MNINSILQHKDIFRITGTPENFLTALRYKVWGFNENNTSQWNKLNQGSIIFFHCKGSDSYFLNRVIPSIIGFGIVGNNFYIDSKPLWIDEHQKGLSYPYKFSFSEIYLFSDIQINNDWDSTSLIKRDNTIQIIKKLLENAIPLSDIPGFPHMGSFSSIANPNVKDALFYTNRNLSFFLGDNESESTTRSSELTSIETISEAFRYSTTLSNFDEVKSKIVNAKNGIFKKDFELLANAELYHNKIISYLLEFFKNRNYKVYKNNHVDLYVHNSENNILFEAKSVENNNYKSQARKGIVQLFEYNYFEVSKFKSENKLSFKKEYNVLVTSQEPSDSNYIKFINSLNIKTAAVKEGKLISYGDYLNFNNL